MSKLTKEEIQAFVDSGNIEGLVNNYNRTINQVEETARTQGQASLGELNTKYKETILINKALENHIDPNVAKSLAQYIDLNKVDENFDISTLGLVPQPVATPDPVTPTPQPVVEEVKPVAGNDIDAIKEELTKSILQDLASQGIIQIEPVVEEVIPQPANLNTVPPVQGVQSTNAAVTLTQEEVKKQALREMIMSKINTK